MRISTMITGILLMGFMVTGFYSIVTSMANTEDGYGVTVDDSYTEAFDKTEEVSSRINASYNDMMQFSANTGLAYLSLIPDALILVKNIIVFPFSILGGMIVSIMGYMGLPAWVTTFTVTIVTVAIIFGFVALILRYKYT